MKKMAFFSFFILCHQLFIDDKQSTTHLPAFHLLGYVE